MSRLSWPFGRSRRLEWVDPVPAVFVQPRACVYRVRCWPLGLVRNPWRWQYPTSQGGVLRGEAATQAEALRMLEEYAKAWEAIL